MSPDPAPPYEFGLSDALRERIQRMLDRAAARGIGPEIQEAVATIFSRLINEPRKWRPDPEAQQVEYHGRHNRFLAVYTVHDRVPIVFLWKLIPQEGNPLFGENFDET